jgi:hypothetical protein
MASSAAALTTNGDHRPAESRAEHRASRMRDREERVRALEERGADRLRDKAGRGGAEERGAHPVQRDHGDEESERGLAGDHRDGQHARAGGAQGVGGEHDPAPREPVRPHAADEHERHPGDDVGGVDDADVGRRPAFVEDREGERDRREVVADQRDRLAREEQAEFALAQRGDGVGHPHAARC